MSAALL